MMKKFGLLFAVLALILASLACQTLSGGETSPQLPPPSAGGDDGEESQPESAEDGGGEESQPEGFEDDGSALGIETEFPLPDGAMNVQDLGGTINFQVKLSLNEAMKFYMDALSSEGYTERSLLTVTSETTFSMVFDGHESGDAIVVQGVDMGDGTVNVSIRLEDV